MQFTGVAGGVAQPARWEAAVKNGIYDVTVGGRRRRAPSPAATHRITVESTNLVNNFTPGSANKIATVTARIQVTDGKVTVDAAGGTNTKLDYIDIIPVAERASAPAPPSPASTSRPAGAPGPAPLHERHRRGVHAGQAATAGSSRPTSNAALDHRQRPRPQPVPDQRLDTFMRMQGTDRRREPAGPLAVRAAHGHLRRHRLGRRLRRARRLTATARRRGRHRHRQLRSHRRQQVQAAPRSGSPVTDGFLTLDAAGGTNTKIELRRDRRRRQRRRGRSPASIRPTAPPNVPLDTSVSLSPSHAVEQTTVTADTVKLLAPGRRPGAPAATTPTPPAAWSSSRPTEQLATNTTYTVADDDRPAGHGGQPVRRLHLHVHHRHELHPAGPGELRQDRPGRPDRPDLDRHRPRRQALRRQRHRRDPALHDPRRRRPRRPPQVFTPFGAFTRTITGLAFEPGSTATNLRLWVSTASSATGTWPTSPAR